MKRSITKYALFLSIAVGVAACNQQPCDCEKQNKLSEASTNTRTVELGENMSFRQRLVSSVSDQVSTIEALPRFNFSAEILEEGKPLDELDFGGAEADKGEVSANVEATELVTSIFNALIAAESDANQLEVEFSMSEEPIDNGSFIFGLNSPTEQELTLMMYDEEGFNVVANNKLMVTEGNNYRALKVKDLEPGSYIFKLQNEAVGKELIRRVEIAG